MALENEVLAPFAGLALDGVVLSDFSERVRANSMPLDVTLTPDFVMDAVDNKKTIKFGRDQSFVLNVAEREVALNYVLLCPLVSENNIANKGIKIAECIITDDTVQKVRAVTFDAGKALPRFKVVAEGHRSIPVASIKPEKFKMYASIVHELVGTDATSQNFVELLTKQDIKYLPFQILNTNTEIKELTWSPKVAIIELVD